MFVFILVYSYIYFSIVESGKYVCDENDFSYHLLVFQFLFHQHLSSNLIRKLFSIQLYRWNCLVTLKVIQRPFTAGLKMDRFIIEHSS